MKNVTSQSSLRIELHYFITKNILVTFKMPLIMGSSTNIILQIDYKFVPTKEFQMQVTIEEQRKSLSIV